MKHGVWCSAEQRMSEQITPGQKKQERRDGNKILSCRIDFYTFLTRWVLALLTSSAPEILSSLQPSKAVEFALRRPLLNNTQH